MPSQVSTESQAVADDEKARKIPEYGVSGRRIVYDKDGKPCRTCNTLLDFQFATGKPSSKTSISTTTTKSNTNPNLKYPKEEPPDVTQLGKSSWTLLHLIAATYPEAPTTKQQQDMKQFINLFSGIYPCWYCGEDFQNYIQKNEIQVKNQNEFGTWLCNAHNDVNKKLGKPEFNCNFWKQRWKDGWGNDNN
ncbi:ERV1 [Candida pseudojiufengensis]|uniref:ERV1 n=1 Tax=Candida pseudojiufengensis TaxID=497109 RepID=UPI00222562DA|nr:ERV1 [Candida pseudojiufengensis]KAI5966846.1 ERV1 [Candida pseudojiufengensis]